MTEPGIFDDKAKQIYETHREEREKLYSGKIIAIDIDNNDLASIGEQISDVNLDNRKKRLYWIFIAGPAEILLLSGCITIPDKAICIS